MLPRIALVVLAIWPFPDMEIRAQTPRAGDDFFAYANSAWLQTAVIPAGRNRWSVRDEIALRTRRQIEDLLVDAERAAPGSLARKVADFRTSLLDDARIEQRGLAPLTPLLSRIDQVGDRVALARLLGSTMRADVDPLNLGVFTSASVLGLSVEHSIHGEKTYTAFLLQGGLALGDRDQYLSADTAVARLRSRYRDYIARMLTLAGFDHADTRADSALALETAIARTQATSDASAPDGNADHQWSRADFVREAPGLDWGAFFEAAGLARQPVVVAWQPQAITGVAALVASRPLESWKDYLRFHVIDEYASVLPRSFAVAAVDMHDDQRTREEHALAITRSALAGPIAELYARRYFSPAQKARVRRIVANVLAVFRAHAARAAWLSPRSRATALAKLDHLYVGIGYPETWEDWSDLRIDASDAFGNLQRVAERDYRHALARLGRAYDPHEWVLSPALPGAILNFQQNAYEFAAALLQSPKYDSTASDAAAYGAIGAIIGHDISHFVDVLGADYAPDGQKRRWWTAADSAQFEAAAEPLVRQFSAYEPLPGLHVDGRLTRTENVADLAGLTAAFEAYHRSLGAEPPDDRAFFIAFAQAFAAKLDDSGMRAQIANDHAPETYRMDTVRNLDAWYAAFAVVPGQRLYLDPRDRVRIW